MKRYCLTQCAKDKLNKGWQNTIETVAVISIGIAFILGVFIASFILGFIYYHVFTYFGMDMKPHELSEYAPLGFAVTVGLLLIGILAYHTWKILKGAYYGLRNILTNQVNKYQGNDYEKCKIFEECKD